jgi:hypothetical protein
LESVRFDTGLIDVGPSFGLNLKDSDGIKFRRTMTCSLMSTINRYNPKVRYSAANDGSRETNSSSDPISLLFNYGTVYSGPVNGTTFAVDQDQAMVIHKYTLEYVKTDPACRMY